MEKTNTPLDVIYEWFSNVGDVMSDMIPGAVSLGLPESLMNGCFQMTTALDSNEFKKWLLKTEGLYLNDIYAHIILTRELIDIYFDGRSTKQDWERKRDKHVNSIIDLKSPEHRAWVREKMPMIKDEDFDKMADGHTGGLNNIDEWSKQHIEAYQEWDKLLDNELSNKMLRKWHDKISQA